MRNRRPPFTGELADRVITGAVALWARHGQTPAKECGLGLGCDDIDRQLLRIDLVVAAKDCVAEQTTEAARRVAADYAGAEPGSVANRQGVLVDQALAALGHTAAKLLAIRPDLDRRYSNRVRLLGIKFWLDGSIDTAWFTRPYAVNPPGKTGAFAGYQQIPDAVLEAAFDRCWATDVQLNLHRNGDAAADQTLRAIAKAIAKHGMRDHRPVFVHASYLRPDQIAAMQRVGRSPASWPRRWSPVATRWGGSGAPKRAHVAMAAHDFDAAGVAFTHSHDAPVSPRPAILPLVDAAVNRITQSGAVVGPAQRITPYAALRGVTAHAAYQIKEERTKGTLEVGKLADLVILGQNPLKVDPRTIQDIPIVETIKDGTTVYRAAP